MLCIDAFQVSSQSRVTLFTGAFGRPKWTPTGEFSYWNTDIIDFFLPIQLTKCGWFSTVVTIFVQT